MFCAVSRGVDSRSHFRCTSDERNFLVVDGLCGAELPMDRTSDGGRVRFAGVCGFGCCTTGSEKQSDKSSDAVTAFSASYCVVLPEAIADTGAVCEKRKYESEASLRLITCIWVWCQDIRLLAFVEAPAQGS